MEPQPGRTTPDAARRAARFPPWSTALFALAWALVTTEGWSARIGVDPIAWLYQPAATAGRVVGRDVELASVPAAGSLARPLRDYLHGNRDDALAGGVGIHSELVELAEARRAKGEAAEAWTNRANAQLGILLAAQESRSEALEVFAELGRRDPAGLALAELYTAPPSPASPDRARDALLLASLEEIGLEGWFADQPRLQLLERRGDLEATESIRAEATARGRRGQRRVEAMALASASMVAVGLVALLLGALRRGPRSLLETPPGGGPPWSLGDGVAVLVRGDLWNRLYFVALNALSTHLPNAQWLGPLYDWSSVLASLPLLWLAWRHLLQPAVGPLLAPFGIGPEGPAWSSLVGITFAAAALNLATSHGLSWIFWNFGFEGHWAEGVDETLIWGGGWEALRASLDYVVWTPMIEEFTFRGLLFFSLRRRLGPWSAALLSAGIFSALHFYSLPGFVSTFCGGFIWAMVFEKSRSLMPGIVIHALYNLLYVSGMLLVYR